MDGSERSTRRSVGCRFVMDGEIFDGPETQPLRIETGPEFTYVCSA